MSNEKNIIGIARDSAPADHDQPETGQGEAIDLEWNGEDQERVNGPDNTQLYDLADDDATTPVSRFIWSARIIGGLVILAWTTLIIYTNWGAFGANITPDTIITIITSWVPPVLLIGVVYLIIIRNSRTEMRRFAYVSKTLSDTSADMEARLQTVNTELSLAREFLSRQGQELESLGRAASKRLDEKAEHISALIGNSDKKMQNIADVSDIAKGNMEKLRDQIPVVITSAKDVSNQIANAGRTAQTQIREMVTGFQRVNEFGQASDKQVLILQERIDAAIASFTQSTDALKEQITITAQKLEKSARDTGRDLSDQGQKLSENMDALQQHITASADNSVMMLTQKRTQFEEALASLEEELTRAASEHHTMLLLKKSESEEQIHAFSAQLEDAAGKSKTRLSQEISQLDEAYSKLQSSRFSEEQALGALQNLINEQIENVHQRISDLDDKGGEKTAQMAFAVNTLNSNLDNSHAAMHNAEEQLAKLSQKSNELQSQLNANCDIINQELAESLSAWSEQFSQSRKSVFEAEDTIQNLLTKTEHLAAKTLESGTLLDKQRQEFSRNEESSDAIFFKQEEQLQTIAAKIADINIETSKLTDDNMVALQRTLKDMDALAQATIASASSALNTQVSDIAQNLADQSEVTLEAIMRAKTEEVVGKLQSAVNKALGATQSVSQDLLEQLNRVDELTSSLESRVSHAQDRAELKTDQDFTRHMALITEALNSCAIDVAKVLSNDVTDTAWASYLRGDRGVFTRRAVRLLENNEVREVGNYYENDTEFRETVNRYIHDFESMLRDILSTRNGHALSITLLSSDIGKLYVALAQAIERFRE